jgi:hypothetical protein
MNALSSLDQGTPTRRTWREWARRVTWYEWESKTHAPETPSRARDAARVADRYRARRVWIDQRTPDGSPGLPGRLRPRLSRRPGGRLSRRARRARSGEGSDDLRCPLRRERRGAPARLGAVEDCQRPWHVPALLRGRRLGSGRLHRHHARARQGTDPRAAAGRDREADPGDRTACHTDRAGERIRAADTRCAVDDAGAGGVAQLPRRVDGAGRPLLQRHAAERPSR